LRLLRSTIDSNVVSLQFVGSGQSLGEATLFSDTYAYTAIAEVAAQVIVYPKQELVTSLRQYSDLAEDVISRLLQKIDTLETNLELKGIRSAPQRILRYLQFLTLPALETTVNVERPWKEIAAELGFTPDTLSRALAKLEQEGRISRTDQRITLHDSSAA
jgi:CRP/FNR family transcriptional regulator, dissimilatory nitrate respiration regulator